VRLARALPKTFFVLLIIIGTHSPLAEAQTVEREGQAEDKKNQPAQRTLERLDVGYQLPVQILAVRNLEAEHWMRDLEVDVRNVSSKPIYELYLTLSLPDDKDGAGRPYGVSLEYGRLKLIDPDQRPESGDAPIAPGETLVLKVAKHLSEGYEDHLRATGVRDSSSRRLRLVVLAVNFGDGTGFINGGVPYPSQSLAPRPQRYVSVPGERN
jgi:hypothetical protein